ncbi:hypothetical protein [Sphingopyxis terrae]|uniref:hypothetical protein n=1 Tax=Sphingopyxis terrae TaxID=33052 RepID=UPI001056DA01|nr:hypothetical protein [Sphingopyxis terrae]
MMQRICRASTETGQSLLLAHGELQPKRRARKRQFPHRDLAEKWLCQDILRIARHLPAYRFGPTRGLYLDEVRDAGRVSARNIERSQTGDARKGKYRRFLCDQPDELRDRIIRLKETEILPEPGDRKAHCGQFEHDRPEVRAVYFQKPIIGLERHRRIGGKYDGAPIPRRAVPEGDTARLDKGNVFPRSGRPTFTEGSGPLAGTNRVEPCGHPFQHM